MLRLDMAGRAVALEFEQTGNFYRVEVQCRAPFLHNAAQ